MSDQDDDMDDYDNDMYDDDEDHNMDADVDDNIYSMLTLSTTSINTYM